MKKSILSINGNKPMNYLLQTVLSGRYSFLAVSDVFEAVQELKKRLEIELIIIDVDYHEQENWDFIQHIRTSGLHQDKRFIVLTSKENKTGKKVDEVKEYVFIYKPFSPLDMIKTIDELMFANTIQS
jgi:CheY-like chemotaxis protein